MSKKFKYISWICDAEPFILFVQPIVLWLKLVFTDHMTCLQIPVLGILFKRPQSFEDFRLFTQTLLNI